MKPSRLRRRPTATRRLVSVRPLATARRVHLAAAPPDEAGHQGAFTRPGDLLAVACTGAYHHSMASNYNMVGRPPVVAVRDGAARLLVRRETASDMRLRDVGL